MGFKKGKKKYKRKEFLLRVKDRNQELSHNNVLMKYYFVDLNRTVCFEYWNKSSSGFNMLSCKSSSSSDPIAPTSLWILCPGNCKWTNNNRSDLCHCRLFLPSRGIPASWHCWDTSVAKDRERGKNSIDQEITQTSLSPHKNCRWIREEKGIEKDEHPCVWKTTSGHWKLSHWNFPKPLVF